LLLGQCSLTEESSFKSSGGRQHLTNNSTSFEQVSSQPFTASIAVTAIILQTGQGEGYNAVPLRYLIQYNHRLRIWQTLSRVPASDRRWPMVMHESTPSSVFALKVAVIKTHQQPEF
jgi:hypothetical protein